MASVIFLRIDPDGFVPGPLVHGLPTTRTTRTAVFQVDGVEVQREIPSEWGDEQAVIDAVVQALVRGLEVEGVAAALPMAPADARAAAIEAVDQILARARAAGVPYPKDPTLRLAADEASENNWTKLVVQVREGGVPMAADGVTFAAPIRTRTVDRAVRIEVANLAELEAVRNALFAAGAGRIARGEAAIDAISSLDDPAAMLAVLADLESALGLS